MGITSKGTTCPLQIMTLSTHVSKIARPLVLGCPGTERRYLVIPLGTVFNFRPRFSSTMSHSFFADGDGGGGDEVFGVLLLRAVESPFVFQLGIARSGIGFLFQVRTSAVEFFTRLGSTACEPNAISD